MEAFEELRQVYAALDTRDLLEEMRSRGIVRAADGAVEKQELVDALVRHDLGMPQPGASASASAASSATAAAPSSGSGSGSAPSSSSSGAAAPPTANADHVAEFCALTGADPGTAAHMLEAMGGSLEQAVAFFLEHGAGSLGSGGGRSNSNAQAQPPRPGGEDGDGEVRAPLPTMRDTLMGPSAALHHHPHAAHIAAAHAAAAAQATTGGNNPPRRSGGGFGAGLVGALLNPLQALAGGRGGGGGGGGGGGVGDGGVGMGVGLAQQQAAMLNGMHGRTGDDETVDWMFKAPEGLSCPLPFQETRQMCKQHQKWLLVNLQDHENFASHRLNRDIWVDETINNLVASGFVFWQRNKTSPEGQQFLTRYHIDVDALPIVAVVDPRTGGKVREYQVATMKKQDLAVLLTDFLDQNSLDSVQPPRAQRSGSLGSRKDSIGSAGAGGGGASPARAGKAGDEDEELARALALSMQEQQAGGEEDDSKPSATTNDGAAGAGAGEATDAMEEEEEEAAAAAPPRRVVEVPAEPPEGTPPAETARLQFRLPPPHKPVRRLFYKSDKVEALYAYVESLVPEAKRRVGPEAGAGAGADPSVATREYELATAFPAKSLDGAMEQTLAEAGLDGAAVMVRFTN